MNKNTDYLHASQKPALCYYNLKQRYLVQNTMMTVTAVLTLNSLKYAHVTGISFIHPTARINTVVNYESF